LTRDVANRQGVMARGSCVVDNRAFPGIRVTAVADSLRRPPQRRVHYGDDESSDLARTGLEIIDDGGLRRDARTTGGDRGRAAAMAGDRIPRRLAEQRCGGARERGGRIGAE